MSMTYPGMVGMTPQYDPMRYPLGPSYGPNPYPCLPYTYREGYPMVSPIWDMG